MVKMMMMIVVVEVVEDQEERSSDFKEVRRNYSHLVKGILLTTCISLLLSGTPFHFALQHMKIFSSAHPLFSGVTVITPVHSNLRA